MGKKKKDPTIEAYQKLKNEIIIDKVDEIFRTQPDNYISALEEIGFKYYDDDDDDMEDLKISSAPSSPITPRPGWIRKIWIHSRN
jgi:hypothetical protein